MPRLEWDKVGERLYETGIDRGVLYPTDATGAYTNGVVWNGLINVSENPTGAEPNPQYADNIKYLNLVSMEELELSIEAFTYPDEFAVCDGSAELTSGVMIGQQSRKSFGLSYRSLIGNDVDGQDLGYKIHLVYGALAGPSEKAYQTINDSPEAITFSWDITTTPVPVEDHKPTASIIIDSTKVDKTKLKTFEDLLYGTDSAEAELPLPAEVLAHFAVLGG